MKTNAEGTGNIDVEGEIRASGMARAMTVYATNTVRSELMVDTPLLNLKPSSSEKSVQVQQDGDTAVKMECFDGTLSKGYARLEIGTPTDANTNAATTVEYVKNKVSGLQTASQVQDAIKNAITAYTRRRGRSRLRPCLCPVAGKAGWVYNIKDAFTTDNHFIEGEGRRLPCRNECRMCGNQRR